MTIKTVVYCTTQLGTAAALSLRIVSAGRVHANTCKKHAAVPSARTATSSPPLGLGGPVWA
eukprot:scaffold137784_cov163-Phaeocystis_antarctica.AAC.1